MSFQKEDKDGKSEHFDEVLNRPMPNNSVEEAAHGPYTHVLVYISTSRI